MFACARLRQVVGTQWGNKKYIKHMEADLEDISSANWLYSCQSLLTFLKKTVDDLRKMCYHKCTAKAVCGYGGIGRRAWFRSMWGQLHAGSTPVIRSLLVFFIIDSFLRRPWSFIVPGPSSMVSWRTIKQKVKTT